MLIYELFLKNKDETDTLPGESIPCKKVYAKLEKDQCLVVLDPKTIDEYGQKFAPDSSQIQIALNMPLLNQKSVGLPDHRTGSNSKPPYIVIFGLIKGAKIDLSMKGYLESGSKGSLSYEFDLQEGKEKLNASNDLLMRLEESKYLHEGVTLFDKYVNEGLISNASLFKASAFLKISEAFKDYCFSRNLKNILEANKKKIPFRLVVLPMSMLNSGKPVECLGDKCESETETTKIDAFAFPMNSYANKPVIDKYSKFISYDDEAFAINCNREEAFYESLGIGDQSIEKIKMPQGFQISGLNWYFMSLTENAFFEKKNTGIYEQLKHVYKKLTEDKSTVPELSQLKIICTDKSNAKIEVLLDENVTIDQLAKNFKFNQPVADYSPPMAFEDVLLDKNQKGKIIWSFYIGAIRSTLIGINIDWSFLLALITKQIRKRLFKWIEELPNCNEATDFFKKSEFCFKILQNLEACDVNPFERYAYGIGQIVGEYLQYKRRTNEITNSTYDIMTYTKYDREKLRFVYQKVVLGLFLSKKYDSQGKAVEDEIANLLPKEEIDDDHSEVDYSYFFYKGLFENLRGVKNEPRT